jgi:predicted metalloprotease
MKWQGRRSSSNVEDRRGIPTGGLIGGGIGAIVIIILTLLMGGNLTDVFNKVQTTTNSVDSSYTASAQEQELAQFVSVVLADTEDVWTTLFQEENQTYEKPKLVLFTDAVESACGGASTSTGPFYCPGDQKVYIDLSFAAELEDRFKAPGDFALAYVIAHEVGHHVQYLLGISDQVAAMKAKLSETEYNALTVRMELQADYFAGVWAHHANDQSLLDPGDLEEALGAASAVGDDRIQKQTQGYIVPDSFTHGTSEQRARWFKKGFSSGTIDGGDTFNAKDL